MSISGSEKFATRSRSDDGQSFHNPDEVRDADPLGSDPATTIHFLISLGSVEVVRIVERDGSRRVQPPDLVIAQQRAETVAIDAAYFLSMMILSP